jgi:hypothetical protein
MKRISELRAVRLEPCGVAALSGHRTFPYLGGWCRLDLRTPGG